MGISNKMENEIWNKAVYTATEVACGWAGAVEKKAYLNVWMQKHLVNAEKANGDRPTDRPKDIAGFRVVVHATKNRNGKVL